jgi:hypothetical protein
MNTELLKIRKALNAAVCNKAVTSELASNAAEIIFCKREGLELHDISVNDNSVIYQLFN